MRLVFFTGLVVMLAGCGLVLELDPPDPMGMDAGEAADASRPSPDARATQDAFEPRDADPGQPDAHMCRVARDCVAPDMCATVSCDEGACLVTWPDEVCDGTDQDCDGSIDEGTLLACLIDVDGDGFGMLRRLCVCPAETVDMPGDCHDVAGDPLSRLVHPGQRTDFSEPYFRGDGTSSYDFDCDGVERPRFADVFSACRRVSGSCEGGGWAGPVAGCGAREVYTFCSADGMGGCVAVMGMSYQYCR